MTDNLRHWSVLSRTDPNQTKTFKRAGGFTGTAIRPIWSAMMMTKHFGPCGTGWGMEKPEFTTMPVGEEILVYCTVALWYREGDSDGHIVYGVGGDKVAVKRKDGGVVADDEAFKKAYTDALSNAMKQVGVGADVHMGLFDDNKYVSELRKEFAAEAAGHADAPPPPAAAPKPQPAPAPARKAPAPVPGKGFDLLFPNGERMANFQDPDEWAHGLRQAIEQKDAQVLALWEVNKPLSEVIRDHYPGVQWADRKGAKFPAHDFLQAIVTKLTPGLAA